MEFLSKRYERQNLIFVILFYRTSLINICYSLFVYSFKMMILPLLYWIEIASNIKFQNLFLCILEIIFEKWIITAVSIQYLIKGMKLIFFFCWQLRNLFQWVVNQENNHANIQENHANLSPGQSLKCLIRKKNIITNNSVHAKEEKEKF